MSESFYHILISIIFIIGYSLIILEPITRIDKTGVSLLTAVACWVVVFITPEATLKIKLNELSEQFLHVSEVTTFILVVLVIIEIMQTHESFNLLTDPIHLKSKRAFLWTIGLITFFLSTIIANVTATIIMLVLCRRFLPQTEDRMIIGGGIVVASNAGGAWTPIGDITTTMLWIGERVTTWPLMRDVFFPSLVSMLVTFIFLHFCVKGNLVENKTESKPKKPLPYRHVIFATGVFSLLLIPVLDYYLEFPLI